MHIYIYVLPLYNSNKLTLTRKTLYLLERDRLFGKLFYRMISYLTALPNSVVPLTWQLIQEVWVVVEENIQNILPTYLVIDRLQPDLTLT